MASRALAIDPNSSAAHFAKASVLLAQGQFEEARAEAERTIELDPSAVGARTALCVVDLYTGQPETVIACIDKGASPLARATPRATVSSSSRARLTSCWGGTTKLSSCCVDR